MCGFIYQKKINKKFNVDKALFKKASKLIYHRGPDSKKYFFSEEVNIFHSRLEIIDLYKRSNQPMTRLGYTIVYNGEIYNFKKIKKELESEFNFQTNSDTEVLLFSFIKWKEKMFQKINGMFSFVIFNSSKNLFFFARDLFGQKPLYFSKDKNQIIFSSEIKPIIKLKRINKINYEDTEVLKYLNFNYYGDSNFTFFKDIFQIKPGTFGYLKKNKLMFKRIKYTNYEKKINTENVLNILQNEIKDHLVSDVETAILISEGVDSKSIVDITEKKFKKNLKLFNLEFEKFDNNEFRKKYSYSYKKNLYFTKFFRKEMFKFLDKTSAMCEAPPLSLFTLGMVKLFKKIKKKNIKVVLNGQGVDEIFGGYNLYYQKQNQSKTYHPDGTVFLNKKNIYKKRIKNNLKLNKNLKLQRQNMAFKSKIPKNLNQYDKISMNYSIECRSPYLTKKLASLIAGLKLSQLNFNGHKKYLFRKSLYNLTNDKFYFNEKRFKQAPQTEYMQDNQNFKLIKKIISKKNYCDKYFNKKVLKNYFNEFQNLKNNGFVIWQYISLNSFLNYFNKFNV